MNGERDGGVFPAPAGMSRGGYRLDDAKTRFPRTCGDEPRFTVKQVMSGSFSPHLRG